MQGEKVYLMLKSYNIEILLDTIWDNTVHEFNGKKRKKKNWYNLTFFSVKTIPAYIMGRTDNQNSYCPKKWFFLLVAISIIFSKNVCKYNTG